MTQIKICGLTNHEDVKKCLDLGVDYLGFVFADSPRAADPHTVTQIRSMVGNAAKMVGVFTEESDRVLEIADTCGLDYIQLHGEQSEDFAMQIGAQRVIRAMKIKDASSLDNVSSHTNAAFYLLDTYSTKAQGGTGQSWNWRLLSDAIIDKPIFLAGGLNPDNVSDAISIIKPYAVDVSSGVELIPGKKDHFKLERLVQNVIKCS